MTDLNKNEIKLIEENNNFVYYFYELILGKYDTGDISNFFIKSNDIDSPIFIISESNDEESLIEFTQNSLFKILGKNIDEKNIVYDKTNFNIIVLSLEYENNNVIINTCSLLEWLISNLIFDNENKSSNVKELISENKYNLYCSNTSDLINEFKEMMENENFKEILESEM